MIIPPIGCLRRITTALAIAITTLALLWAALFWWRRFLLPWDGRLVAAIVVPTAASMMAIWWLWWRLPRRQLHKLDIQIHDPKARADTEDNFRKTIGQALGGIAVLIGAGVAYLQFTEQQRASDQQSLRQQQAAHDLLISNQVSKGFEQLANDKSLTMRLGGIYGLEGVMKTSPEYYQPVLEALCAFVRDGTIGKSVGDQPATDVQAALTVIGRRKPGPGQVDLANADIPHANLHKAPLSDANLRGANLRNADLSNANLRGAYMTNATLENTDLDSSDLSGLEVAPGLVRVTDLRGAHLRGADLTGASLQDTNLNNADLRSADLRGAILKDADLGGADLTDALLGDARYLIQTQLDQACGKPKALPDGLKLDKPCPEHRVAPASSQKEP